MSAPEHHQHPPSLCPSLAASPVRRAGSPPRFVRPPPPPQRSSLDFGVQVFAPPPAPQQEVQAQMEWQSLVEQQQRQAMQASMQRQEEAALAVVALPSTASQLEVSQEQKTFPGNQHYSLDWGRCTPERPLYSHVTLACVHAACRPSLKPTSHAGSQLHHQSASSTPLGSAAAEPRQPSQLCIMWCTHSSRCACKRRPSLYACKRRR